MSDLNALEFGTVSDNNNNINSPGTSLPKGEEINQINQDLLKDYSSEQDMFFNNVPTDGYDSDCVYATKEFLYTSTDGVEMVCIDLFYDYSILKIGVKSEFVESTVEAWAKYLGKKVYMINCPNPSSCFYQLSDSNGFVSYISQDYSNPINRFMGVIDTILHLSRREVTEGLSKVTYYPELMVFSKKKLTVKIPSKHIIGDDVLWKYSYLVDYDGRVDIEVLHRLSSVYPEAITQELINTFVGAYNDITNIANQELYKFSLTYSTSIYSLIQKMNKKFDVIVKALINVARMFEETHLTYKSDLWRIFQESRMQDVESEGIDEYDVIDYKGEFMLSTFKEFLGVTEDNKGNKVCVLLDILNNANTNPLKREEYLKLLKSNEELKSLYLYLYHSGNNEQPAQALMADYDKYERIRQECVKYVWLFNWLIHLRESNFGLYVASIGGSCSNLADIKVRPKKYTWCNNNLEELINIRLYKRRKKSTT